MRFDAIRTISGAEVFDNVLGRPVEFRPNYRAAQQLAQRLNERVAGLAEPRVIQEVARALAS